MIKKIKASYRPFFKAFKIYKFAYGGVSEVLFSPYLHLSIVFTVAVLFVDPYFEWWPIALDILPSMISFTLAGYAIMLSFSASSVGKLISSDDFNERSMYLQVSGTFFHFVFMQIIALMFAIFSGRAETFLDKHFPELEQLDSVSATISIASPIIFVASSFAFLLFIYSVLLSLAALVAILRLSGVVDMSLTADTIAEAEDAKNDVEKAS